MTIGLSEADLCIDYLMPEANLKDFATALWLWCDPTSTDGALNLRLDVRGSVSMRQYFRTDSCTV